jgi:hypothetical protein
MKTILTRVSSRFIANSHALLKEIQYLELSVVKSLLDQTLRRNEKSSHFLELVSSLCFERRRIGFFTTHEERCYLRSKGIPNIVESCYF